jgi:hypothetical protein
VPTPNAATYPVRSGSMAAEDNRILPVVAGAASEDRGTRGWARGVPGTGLRGLLGRPFLPLGRYVAEDALDGLHEEICLALAQVPCGYTGGSHRSMGIMPADRAGEALVDYGEVVAGLDPAQRERLASLADDPSGFAAALSRGAEIGEERDAPLNHRQMLWLERRHHVYFPWKAYVELMPNGRWQDKADPEGKRFTRTAEAFFPRTLAFVRALPFRTIGRCNVMGLAAHDHGTVHRDVVPEEQVEPDHFVTFCPGGDKRLLLHDRSSGRRVAVEGRVYWFNDADDHEVEAAPWFRYSVRVDGVFEPAFLQRLRADMEGETASPGEVGA